MILYDNLKKKNADFLKRPKFISQTTKNTFLLLAFYSLEYHI